jgi:hypothetical protein
VLLNFPQIRANDVFLFGAFLGSALLVRISFLVAIIGGAPAGGSTLSSSAW